jgi:PleD family two-component response regulator
VLARCASENDAALAFERLRLNVERYPFPQVGRLTISIGLTEVRATDTPSAAFARADRAVYVAKATGRNRVASHAELVASGAIDASEVYAGPIELFSRY